MATAKDIKVQPISATDARTIMTRLHYSGKVVNNSLLHLGVFLDGRCGGAMSFGSPTTKRTALRLVKDTPWNGMMELNRMAFADWLPRFSESRALGVAFRFLRKHAPHVEWVLSFSDATQCGDGAIYRASGFLLTDIRQSDSLWRLPSGEVVHTISFRQECKAARARVGMMPSETFTAYAARVGATLVPGYQLRYVRLLSATPDRLTVPVLPFSAIDTAGARMYRGVRPGSIGADALGSQPGEGGSSPTPGLHTTNDPTQD